MIKTFKSYNESVTMSDYGESFLLDAIVVFDDIIGEKYVKMDKFFYDGTKSAYDFAFFDKCYRSYRVTLYNKGLEKEGSNEENLPGDNIIVDSNKFYNLLSEIVSFKARIEKNGLKIYESQVGEESFVFYIYYPGKEFIVPSNIQEMGKKADKLQDDIFDNWGDKGWVFEFNQDLNCYTIYNLNNLVDMHGDKPMFDFKHLPKEDIEELISLAKKSLPSEFKVEVYYNNGKINVTNKKLAQEAEDYGTLVIAAFFPPKGYITND